jgi:hypothetical protein
VNMAGDTGFLDLMGSNYSQIDKHQMEETLKRSSILLDDEQVELAFQCNRDSFIMTSKRILKIDVQGITGKKVEYLTILWPAIKGFSVETAGNIIDRDSELTLFFNLPDIPSCAEGFPRNSRTRMKIDFRDGKADLFAVQKYIADKLIGVDTMPSSKYANGMIGQYDHGSGSFLAWIGDDNRMIDAADADRKFHTAPPILQNCETVEMAFRGRRDMILFTGKRLIFVDIQGFLGMGKKVEYLSVPWTTVSAFSVRSAGSWVDKDSEMCLWLDFDDVFNPRRNNEDDPPPPPIPRKSWVELDFQKDRVDLMVIHRYLSERCMRVNHHLKPCNVPVSPDTMRPSGAMENLMNWIGNNAAAIDAKAVEAQFRESNIIQPDEHVAFAFKTGRDSLYFTNKRIFLIDVQGFTGKRKEYMSIPLDMIRVWSLESAGHFDRDMELTVWFKGFWGNKVKQDLRNGKADIVAIQKFIAHFVIGNADGETALQQAAAAESRGSSMDKLLSFLNNNATIEDPALMTETLRTSPPILQEDESIDAAYKCGRDLFIISTKRIIVIDRKGITGKSTEWKSFPLMYNKAFWVETEGHMLNGSELKVYTDDDDIKQGLAKGQNDSIWTIHELLSTKMLDEKHEEIGDSEIELSGGSSFLSPDQQVTSAPIMASVYQPQPFTFQVQLPANVSPGMQLQVQHPQTGQMLLVIVPDGVPVGGLFNVSI